MVTYEIATALGPFFDWIGPSHEELTLMFRRAGLTSSDPLVRATESVGKKVRVRTVVADAASFHPEEGDRLVADLLGALRACGSFLPGAKNYPGNEAVHALQAAFDREGYILDDDGNLRPKALENLQGAALTEALTAYVRRALQGDSDAALLVGTAKDLAEATARHVLVETRGAYEHQASFGTTLTIAFEQLGLATPPVSVLSSLDSDPVKAMQQALFLATLAGNQYRNREGTGHGRPLPSQAQPRDARLATEIAGVVSGLLLESMTPSKPASRAS
ncbi:MAG: abortive infection family protein [Actinomycetota bacterium]